MKAKSEAGGTGVAEQLALEESHPEDIDDQQQEQRVDGVRHDRLNPE